MVVNIEFRKICKSLSLNVACNIDILLCC